ncbi:MAG: 4Fe-4S binding protein [Elusimicrobiota bacterium]|jgi:formate hydrogenlyase subunit 6/NADH:ubiquinone oxidoreductase subunit I|nr:4Fe-4S binding protein [Elusimicrobiota bacterium]
MAKPLSVFGELVRNFFKKASTQGYPFKKASVDSNFRAQIKYDPALCVGCQLCVKNCPADAIKIIQINPEDKPQVGADGKVIPVHRKFECKIDLTRCIFCAQCVDSCFKKALSSSQDFELASTDRSSLVYIKKYQDASQDKADSEEKEQK